MTALRSPNFRRLWLAGLISESGDWLLIVSLPILVYQYTGSTFGTATAFLIALAPPVILAPLSGLLGDRPDRRRTLLVVSLAQAVTLTPLLLVEGRSELTLIYAVIAVQSALAALFEPTKSALLPTLVERDQLVSANSLVGLNQNIGRLAGGSLGGFLLAVGGGRRQSSPWTLRALFSPSRLSHSSGRPLRRRSQAPTAPNRSGGVRPSGPIRSAAR